MFLSCWNSLKTTKKASLRVVVVAARIRRICAESTLLLRSVIADDLFVKTLKFGVFGGGVCTCVRRTHANMLTYFEASGGPTVQILSITLKRLFAPALRRHSQFLQQKYRWGVSTRLNLTSIFVFIIIVLFIFGIFETIFQVYLRLNCVLWFSFVIWSWTELQFFFPMKSFVYTNWRHLVVRIQTATLTSPVWTVDWFPSCWCGGRLERVLFFRV